MDWKWLHKSYKIISYGEKFLLKCMQESPQMLIVEHYKHLYRLLTMTKLCRVFSFPLVISDRIVLFPKIVLQFTVISY